MGYLSHEWTDSPPILLRCSRKWWTILILLQPYREQVSPYDDLHHQWNGLRSGSGTRVHWGV